MGPVAPARGDSPGSRRTILLCCCWFWLFGWMLSIDSFVEFQHAVEKQHQHDDDHED